MLTNFALGSRTAAVMCLLAAFGFSSSSADARGPGGIGGRGGPGRGLHGHGHHHHQHHHGHGGFHGHGFGGPRRFTPIFVPAYTPFSAPVMTAEPAMLAEEPAPTPMTSLADQARQMLKNRDYAGAQQAVDGALRDDPQNGELMQLKSLISFAQGNYQKSAESAYAGLGSSRPMDWKTIQQLYPSVPEYTQQYHDLSSRAKKEPAKGDRQFLLAYHHLMLGHQQAARTAMQAAQRTLPSDPLIAKLLEEMPDDRAAEDAPVQENPFSAEVAVQDDVPADAATTAVQ